VTNVMTFRVLLREGEAATEYTLERTYRGLTMPTCEGRPVTQSERPSVLRRRGRELRKVAEFAQTAPGRSR
jgi:hypothetical protein